MLTKCQVLDYRRFFTNIKAIVMHLLDPLNKDYSRLSEIYEKVSSKNAVALLGAGASVTDKEFLSSTLINLYQAKIHKDFGTIDIIKFVDILQATQGLRRGDFDKFVVDRLMTLTPNEGHSIFVTIPWKQVITTNYDTLIEEASTIAIRDGKTHFNLKTIKNKIQLEQQSTNNEIVYIKLNGCKTDLSLYPLVFSTEDFAKQNSYYKKVLSPFKQFSNEITYISFGYSFTDSFAEKLLEKLIDNDYRQKRLVYCVDPHVNEDKLNYFESQNISIVKMSFEDFFVNYNKWFANNNKNYLQNLQRFTNPDNSKIKIDASSRLYLDNSIVQLKDDNRTSAKVKKIDFYIGEEPTYQVILDEFDVVKQLELNNLLALITKSYEDHTKTSVPKLILINGDFGSGKTTFTLRAIKEYLKGSSNAIAFEIIKSIGSKQAYITQLIKESSATHFIFYCDNIETDSVFKSFNDLRIDLAAAQYSDIKIIFISSIRQNILARFKSNQNISIINCEEFHFNSFYTEKEIGELVDNLKDVELLNYRDQVERSEIIRRIKSRYAGDSFITLYQLIQNGHHYKLLEKAYEELTDEIKIAFKLTALVHRFGIYCPVSIIKNAIKTMGWEEFTYRVVKGDGKNILTQVSDPTMSSNPDLFFKTKHPIIADALIKSILKNAEKNSLYKNIFSSLTYSEFNSRFIVDLIKNIRLNDPDITVGQIDNYYEICRKEFESSPHFLISHITNIEKKTNSILALNQCIKDIELLEGTLEYRNNRLIHRKGCLNFKIARILLQEKNELTEIKYYLDVAEEWFFIKKQLDPSSNYSYIDYLKLLLWKLRNISLEDKELLSLNLTISNLFDEAFKLLFQNTQILHDLFEEYKSYYNTSNHNNADYLEFLLEKYRNVETRPTASVLLYYYYENRGELRKSLDFINEIESYGDDKDVAYFLFKYYGRNLYAIQNRVKFFEIVRHNDFLVEQSTLRFYYYSSICEFYNYRWNDGKECLLEIRRINQSTYNPDFFLYWCDENGEQQLFEGEIFTDRKVKKVKIVTPFFREFVLINGDYSSYRNDQQVTVKLRFLFDGIRAEIVD